MPQGIQLHFDSPMRSSLCTYAPLQQISSLGIATLRHICAHICTSMHVYIHIHLYKIPSNAEGREVSSKRRGSIKSHSFQPANQGSLHASRLCSLLGQAKHGHASSVLDYSRQTSLVCVGTTFPALTGTNKESWKSTIIGGSEPIAGRPCTKKTTTSFPFSTFSGFALCPKALHRRKSPFESFKRKSIFGSGWSLPVVYIISDTSEIIPRKVPLQGVFNGFGHV